jgi:hypothetical protein
MDAHDFARLASLVVQERQTVNAALARFQTHTIGLGWRGLSRQQAESSRELAIEVAILSLAALDEAEQEAIRLWRAALVSAHPLGV